MDDSNIIPISANPKQLGTHSPQVPTSLSDARLKLAGGSAKAGTAELMACLTLVAPGGMSSEDRQAWVAVARQALTGIPGDLLKRGCHHAMLHCRFPSEIVPAIMDEIALQWKLRRETLAHEEAAFANRFAPRIEKQEPQYLTADEFRSLMKAWNDGDAA